jgi:hypothetical protein
MNKQWNTARRGRALEALPYPAGAAWSEWNLCSGQKTSGAEVRQVSERKQRVRHLRRSSGNEVLPSDLSCLTGRAEVSEDRKALHGLHVATQTYGNGNRRYHSYEGYDARTFVESLAMAKYRYLPEQGYGYSHRKTQDRDLEDIPSDRNQGQGS